MLRPAPCRPGHPRVASGRIGVLLVNLGTPDAPTYWPMRRYLKEFLSDRRVIEVPRAPVVATPQPRHPDDPPGQERREVPVDLGQGGRMPRRSSSSPAPRRRSSRPPSPAGRPARGRLRHALRQSRHGRRASTPSAQRAATASSSCRSIRNMPRRRRRRSATRPSRIYATLRWQPALRVAPHWHDDPVYIEALAASVRREPRQARFRARGHPRLLPWRARGSTSRPAIPTIASPSRRAAS